MEKFKKYIIIIIFSSLMTFGCMKEIDDKVIVNAPNYPIIQVELGEQYEYKAYYSLAQNSLVAQKIQNNTWDIAFSSSLLSRPVIQNYSISSSVNGVNTRIVNFDNPISKSVYINSRNQNLVKYANYYTQKDTLFNDNFIISNNQFISKNFVYVIQINKNIGDQSPEYIKIQIISLNQQFAEFQYSDLDNRNKKIVKLPIDPNTNYTYFSFKTNSAVIIEPPKNLWDIEITRFTKEVTQFGITQYYAVSGALLNPSKSIEVAKFENKDIDDITLSSLNSVSFSRNLDEIGYDWKQFSQASNNGYYTILKRTYAIRTGQTVYLLQFIGNTRVVGNRIFNGYPEFTVKKI